VLKIKSTGQILLIEKHIGVAMFGNLFFELGNKVVVFIEEL